MTFAYADPTRLILGTGQLYLNDVLVGALNGPVNFTIRRTFAEQRPGNALSPVKAEVSAEEAFVTSDVCEFNVNMIRKAMGLVTDPASGSIAVRFSEQIALNALTTTALGHTPIAASENVYKLDKSVQYTSSTDYLLATANLSRKSGSTIADGQKVLVEYNFAVTANYLRGGGDQSALPEYALRYVGTKSNGKKFQFQFWRCYVNTDFSIAFNPRSTGNFTTHGFSARALIDTSKIDGENLFEIAEEA